MNNINNLLFTKLYTLNLNQLFKNAVQLYNGITVRMVCSTALMVTPHYYGVSVFSRRTLGVIPLNQFSCKMA